MTKAAACFNVGNGQCHGWRYAFLLRLTRNGFGIGRNSHGLVVHLWLFFLTLHGVLYTHWTAHTQAINCIIQIL